MFSKRFKLAAIDIAKKYLSGAYDFQEFIQKLTEDKRVFNYVKKYFENKLYCSFPNIEFFKNTENTYWNRHHYYNLMYTYLFSMKVDVETYCDEYSIYRKLDQILPEWFQLDVFLLYEIFPNLDELIEENRLIYELKKICKCESDVFPIWLQSPEWPVNDKVPLTFINQTLDPNSSDFDGHEISYYFLDEKTNEQVIITQVD